MPPTPNLTGTQINYYLVCKRKLWLSTRDIGMEHTSDIVHEGKLIHEDSYNRMKKEISIGDIKIDFIKKDSGVVIHEVKKSKKIEKAHLYQLLYYLFYLKNLGVEASGVIDYPLLRKREKVSLTPENESEILRIINGIREIIALPKSPDAERKKICGKCSYFEFCWC